jgi:cellulose synthase operon protein YhjQ
MTLICFASPKGGVGKTTLAANVANELARSGQRVIALDLDPQNALRLHFGISLNDTAGFTGLLTQRPDWRRCLRETSAGISLLPYGSSEMDDAVALAVAVAQTPALLQEPVDEILSSPDTCLVVDTPPGPSSLLAALLPRIDLLVTVLLVDATSISLIPTLEQGGGYGVGQAEDPGATMGFILNQFDPRTRLGGIIGDAATRHLGDRLLGTIYRDECVGEAVAAQKFLANYAPGSKANQDIAATSRAILTRLQMPLSVAGAHRGRTSA